MQEQEPVNEREVGVVIHYWNHLGVAGVHLTEPLSVGDRIHIVGHTTDFEQEVGSIQIDHQEVHQAKPGDDVGIRVVDHARDHDTVFKVVAEDVGADQHSL